MDYVIHNPTAAQLAAVADCNPQPAVTTDDNRIHWMQNVRRFYEKDFADCVASITESDPGELIPWERLGEDQQEELAAELLSIDPFMDELGVYSDCTDYRDLLQFFLRPTTPRRKPHD